MHLNKGGGITGVGGAGWRQRGKNWDNCNSIINKGSVGSASKAEGLLGSQLAASP